MRSNDCLDDAIASGADHLKGAGRLFEFKVVRYERGDIHFPRCDQFDGAFHTFVLAPDVKNPKFVAADLADVETDALDFRNADNQQCATWFEQAYGLINCGLLPGAFEHHVEAQRFQPLDCRAARWRG